MRLIGIDPSFSRTGVCVIDGDAVTFTSIKSDKSLSIFDRQKQLLRGCKQLLQKDDIVTFEDFSVSARFAPSGRFCERIELCGMLKLVCPMITKLPWLCITPSMLKSFATGHSTCHKEEVMKAITEKWGMVAANNDEADAYVLARYTKAVFDNESEHAKKIEKFLSYNENEIYVESIRRIIF